MVSHSWWIFSTNLLQWTNMSDLLSMCFSNSSLHVYTCWQNIRLSANLLQKLQSIWSWWWCKINIMYETLTELSSYKNGTGDIDGCMNPWIIHSSIISGLFLTRVHCHGFTLFSSVKYEWHCFSITSFVNLSRTLNHETNNTIFSHIMSNYNSLMHRNEAVQICRTRPNSVKQ